MRVSYVEMDSLTWSGMSREIIVPIGIVQESVVKDVFVARINVLWLDFDDRIYRAMTDRGAPTDRTVYSCLPGKNIGVFPV